MYKKLILFTLTLLFVVYVDFIFIFNSKIVLFFLFFISFVLYRERFIVKNDFLFKKNNILIFFIGIITITVFIIGYNMLVNHFINDFNLKVYTKPLIYNLLIIFLISIFEELIFRGYFLKQLLISENKLKAIILTSLSFSICHFFTDSGLLYVFISSLIISIIYLFTKSVLIVIILHLYSNFVVLFLFNKLITLLN